mgnify:CR=1 FL=1
MLRVDKVVVSGVFSLDGEDFEHAIDQEKINFEVKTDVELPVEGSMWQS